MKSQPADTFAAIVTPIGEGGIGLIEVAGPLALPIVERIFRPTRPRNLAAVREGRLCHGFVHDEQGPIDEAILCICPRTQRVEINCHGGVAAVRKILDLVLRSGAAPAAPEDLLMETMGGGLDEIRREALRLLPRASTRLTVRMLLAQYGGALSSRLTEIAGQADVHIMCDGMEDVLATADFGIALCAPRRVVVAGKPNVGKSTLVNALLREERVIVHHLPGTTRDAISETAELRGIPFEVIDTAGIRRTQNEIEVIGAEESRAEINRADLVLLLLDLSQPIGPEDEELLGVMMGRETILVANKADQEPAWDVRDIEGAQVLNISALTGEGLDALEDAIVRRYGGGLHDPTGPVVFTERQRTALAAARTALDGQHIEEARTHIQACLGPQLRYCA
ncbi:MAG: GTPase [Planctomycetota bacterium]